MADLQSLSEKNYLMIRDMEKGMNEKLIKQFFVETKDGSPVIKKAGLMFKLNEKYGKGNYSIETQFPSDDEIEKMKKFHILAEGRPFVLLKGIVTILATGARFVNYYFGTESNTYNLRNIFEITETRCQLRAARNACENGFYVEEEIIGNPSIQITELPPQEDPQDDEQRKTYSILCKNLSLTKNPNQLRTIVKNALNGREVESTKNLSKVEMSTIINVLHQMENARLIREQDEKVKKEKEDKERANITEATIVQPTVTTTTPTTTQPVVLTQEEKSNVIEGEIVNIQEVNSEKKDEGQEVKKEEKAEKLDSKKDGKKIKENKESEGK